MNAISAEGAVDSRAAPARRDGLHRKQHLHRGFGLLLTKTHTTISPGGPGRIRPTYCASRLRAKPGEAHHK